jgi:TP901 family phage tail tape measure protein
MSNIIRSFIVRTGVDMSGMTVGLSKLSSDLKRAGRQITSTGQSLTKSLTIPLLAVAAASVKFASDFEDGMAKVETIADTAAKSIGTLSDEVMSVSDNTGKAADELSESLYQAISAGANTADAMDLVDVAAKSAIAGFTDTTTAVDGLTSVLNAYGMETKDANDLANLFLITQNKGKTTFGELASSIGKVSSSAASANIPIEELLASIATITAQGISTSEAITGLKAALTNIVKPSSEASKTAEQLGIDFSATALQSKGLAGFLDDVKTATSGNLETMSKLFGSSESLNAILKLTSDEGMASMNDTLTEMQTNTTALDDAYETMSGTMSNQLKIALNSLKNVGIELGQKLMPIVNDGIIPAIKGFAEWIGKLIDGFNNLSPFMQKMVTLALAIAVAIGPLTTIVGKLITTVAGLIKSFQLAQMALAGGGGFLSAITTFLGPAGTVVVAIAAIAAVVGTLIIAFGSANEETEKLKEEIKDFNAECEESKKTFDGLIESNEASAAAASTLTDELYDLADKENKTNTEKMRMKDIVDQLNKMYEDLNLTIDETTGMLNLEKEAVDDVIASNLKRLQLSAYSDRVTKLYEEQYIATENLKNITDSFNDSQKNQIKAFKDSGLEAALFNDIMDDGKVTYGEGTAALDILASSIGADLVEAYVNANVAIAENNNNLEDAEIAYGDLSKSVSASSDVITESAKETGTAWEDLSDTQKTTLEEMGVQQDTYANMTDEDLQALVDSYNQWNDDVKSATDEYLNNMGGFWSDSIDMQEEGMDSVKKNLETQIDQFNTWRTNIKSLVGKVPQDVYDYLYELGPTASTLIAEMSTASKPELDNFVSTVQEWMGVAADEAKTKIGTFAGSATTAVDDAANVIKNDTSVASSANSLGASISDGMKSGMSSRFSSLVSYAKSIAQSVINAIKNVIKPGSPSKVTTIFGRSISDGLFSGIAQTAQKAISKARDLSTGIIDALSFDSIQAPSLAGFNATDSVALQRSLQLDLVNASAVKSADNSTSKFDFQVAFTGPVNFSNDMDVEKVATKLGYYFQQNLSAQGVK